MRRYFFTNFYVSGVRTGIQSGHAAEEMWLFFVKRLLDNSITEDERSQLVTLVEFAENHKTWIVLNGGDHEALVDLREFMSSFKNPYPWSYFTEPGLNNAITSVSIVLPESMYDDAAKEIGQALAALTSEQKFPPSQKYTWWELQLLMRMATCDLAS